MIKKLIAIVILVLVVILGVYMYTNEKMAARSGGVTNLGSLYVSEGGVRQGGLNATSTAATSYTLVAADVTNIQTLVLTPTVGALTLTLPASTTLQALVPNIGDEYNFAIINGTTTAAQKITLVKTANLGVDVKNASTSLDILPQGIMWFDVIRSTNSTTTVLLIPGV